VLELGGAVEETGRKVVVEAGVVEGEEAGGEAEDAAE
jgi:hypothetical protein